MKAHTFFRLSISIELLKKNIRKAIIKYSKKKTWRGFTNKKFKKYKKNSFTQKFQIPATHCQWRPASHPKRSSISADGTCRNWKIKKKKISAAMLRIWPTKNENEAIETFCKLFYGFLNYRYSTLKNPCQLSPRSLFFLFCWSNRNRICFRAQTRSHRPDKRVYRNLFSVVVPWSNLAFLYNIPSPGTPRLIVCNGPSDCLLFVCRSSAY